MKKVVITWIVATISIVLISWFVTAFTAKMFTSFGKPVIYLYPEKDQMVSVQLDVNGKITISEPIYPENGWQVYTTKESLIDNQYPYLFYEADVKDNSLPQEGWITDDIEVWFDEYLLKLGLNEKEANDFTDYWLKHLPDSKYYKIKLYSNEYLEKNLKLTIDPKPDTVIRVNLHIEPINRPIKIDEPKITSPIRKGFTVVEWGVVIGS
jgi:hypothetical protein